MKNVDNPETSEGDFQMGSHEQAQAALITTDRP